MEDIGHWPSKMKVKPHGILKDVSFCWKDSISNTATDQITMAHHKAVIPTLN